MPPVDFFVDARTPEQQKVHHSDDYTNEMLAAIKTATKNKTFVPDGVIKSLKFPDPSSWPGFSAEKTGKSKDADRAAQVLNRLTSLIELHAAGTYEDVLKPYHLNGQGVSEAGPLMFASHRLRLSAPGNVYEQVGLFLKGDADPGLPIGKGAKLDAPLSVPEQKMLYTALISVDKNTQDSDSNVANISHSDGYNHKDVLDMLHFFSKHYKSYKTDLGIANLLAQG